MYMYSTEYIFLNTDQLCVTVDRQGARKKSTLNDGLLVNQDILCFT